MNAKNEHLYVNTLKIFSHLSINLSFQILSVICYVHNLYISVLQTDQFIFTLNLNDRIEKVKCNDTHNTSSFQI